MKDIELNFIHKARHLKNDTVSLHSHCCSEIVLYISAHGETIIGNKKHLIKSGAIALINEGTEHNERHFSKSKLIYFGYNTENSHLKPKEGVYISSEFEKLIHIAEVMYDEIKMQRNGYKPMVSAMLTTFFVLFERELCENASSYKSLEYCANYMRENFSQLIDLKQLAVEYDYGYDKFRHVFKTEYGMPPLKYIIFQRLSNAYRLLSETDMTCTDVSMQCGFSDSSQFSKMFKKQFGISPKKFQAKHKDSVWGK